MSLLTRKVQIIPVGDAKEIKRVYDYLRDGMTAQNKAMNQYMSALYVAAVEDATKEDRKELSNLFSRVSNSKKGSAYDVENIKFPIGLRTTACLWAKVTQDFNNQMKKGLMYGRVSLINYKLNNPLLIHVDYVRLMNTSPKNFGTYHNYENHNELVDALKKGKPDIFIKFANNITFKYVFGNPYKSAFLREEFIQIFEENYEIRGSSIQFDKTGKKIILNLTIKIPDKKIKLDKNTVVGVDVGIVVPACCSLNNGAQREFIGSKDDFLKERLKYQSEKRRRYKALKITNGGKGRKKKLKSVYESKNKEREWAKNYNHIVSKKVVDFALKNNAAYINLEDLTGYDSNKFILRNWSYYELQNMITYKAKTHGIKVRKVKAAYTSQKCSCCGKVNEENRENQNTFKCKNKDCKMFDIYVNTDYNASVNIARSTEFIEKDNQSNTDLACLSAKS